MNEPEIGSDLRNRFCTDEWSEKLPEWIVWFGGLNFFVTQKNVASLMQIDEYHHISSMGELFAFHTQA